MQYHGLLFMDLNPKNEVDIQLKFQDQMQLVHPYAKCSTKP